VVTAARIGRMFRMDPVEVLNDRGNDFILHVRIAALKIAARDEEEAKKK
jgi:hypothetical protein